MLLTSLALATVIAQSEAPAVKLTISDQPLLAGSVVRGELAVSIAPGLHGYQNPPTVDYQIPFTVSSGDANILLVRYPAGEPATIGGDTTPSMTYEGEVLFPVLVRVPRKAGEHSVVVKLRYQLCNESSCFPPGSVSATAKIKVVENSVSAIAQRGRDLLLLAPAVTK